MFPITNLKKIEKELEFSNTRRLNIERTLVGILLGAFLILQVYYIRATDIRYLGLMITVLFIGIFLILNLAVGSKLRSKIRLSRFRNRSLDLRIKLYTFFIIFFLLGISLISVVSSVEYYNTHRYYGDGPSRYVDNETEARVLSIAEEFDYQQHFNVTRYDGVNISVGKHVTESPNYIDETVINRYYKEFNEIEEKQLEGFYAIHFGARIELVENYSFILSENADGDINNKIDTDSYSASHNRTWRTKDKMVFHNGTGYELLDATYEISAGDDFRLEFQDVYLVRMEFGLLDFFGFPAGFVLNQHCIISEEGTVLLVFTEKYPSD